MTTVLQSAMIATLSAAAAVGLAMAFETPVAETFAHLATMLTPPKQ